MKILTDKRYCEMLVTNHTEQVLQEYITSLEEKISELYQVIKELKQENKELKERIDKAIEYINCFMREEEEPRIDEKNYDLCIKLQELLDGDK